MRRTLVGIAALVCVSGCASTSGHAHDETSDPSIQSDSESTSSDSETVAPDPDGTFTSSCSYVLGDQTESKSGYRFLADAELENTGNIGIVTKVTAKWLLAGGDHVSEHKKVRLKPGKSERAGFVHVATGDEIDRHQSLDVSADNCSVDTEIVDTFGDTQPQ